MCQCGSNQEGESNLPPSEVQQLRADLTTRERENAELRAQVEGLRRAMEPFAQSLEDPEVRAAFERKLAPFKGWLTVDDFRNAATALSLSPAAHASQAFQRGMERAAEIVDTLTDQDTSPEDEHGLGFQRAVRIILRGIRAEAERLKEQA